MIKPEPLSPQALVDGFNEIRRQHGLPEVADVSEHWNNWMDKIGAERGSWEELADLFKEEDKGAQG